MRDIIRGIAVKKLIAYGHMAICRDIQTKYDLLAVRPKILVVTLLELNGLRIGRIVFANECHRGAVIMNFICQQFVNGNGVTGQLGHLRMTV